MGHFISRLLLFMESCRFSSEKCSECGMEGDPCQEFVQSWTQGQGTYTTVSVCMYACHLQILLIASTLYIYSFYDRLIYDVNFLEMVATTILITCLYLVSLCVHAVNMHYGCGMENYSLVPRPSHPASRHLQCG